MKSIITLSLLALSIWNVQPNLPAQNNARFVGEVRGVRFYWGAINDSVWFTIKNTNSYPVEVRWTCETTTRDGGKWQGSESWPKLRPGETIGGWTALSCSPPRSARRWAKPIGVHLKNIRIKSLATRETPRGATNRLGSTRRTPTRTGVTRVRAQSARQ